jgi:hypothetical protein
MAGLLVAYTVCPVWARQLFCCFKHTAFVVLTTLALARRSDYSWFAQEHAGDFVVTLGGYHPAFPVPAHYPQVPRLGFNWQVDSNLLAKGNLYYALTASALMAGGHLEVTWNSGPFQAWFNVGADFLLSWKPYYYTASAYVNIGASYTYQLFGTHHLTVDIGASVDMWGPDFSGTAHVDLSIISFDISFGRASNQPPQPIDWPTFSTSFLPEASAVCSLNVKNGLISAPTSGPVQWILNPKDLVLTAGTAIPILSATLNGQAIAGITPAPFGVSPMKLTTQDLTSEYAITIFSPTVTVTEDDFACKPVNKDLPAGLWGQKFQPDLKDAAFVPGALTGFEISLKQPPDGGETVAVPDGVLQLEPETLPAYTWGGPLAYMPNTATDADRRTQITQTITAPATISARDQLLQDLQLEIPIDVTPNLATSFLFAPLISA